MTVRCRRMMLFLASSILFISPGGCNPESDIDPPSGGGSSQNPPGPNPGPGPGPGPGSGNCFPFATIEKGTQSQHPLANSATEVVIKDATTWTQFYSLHKPTAPVPIVDFAQDQVLAVFQGQKPTSGYSIDVQRISLDLPSGNYYVEIVERSPAPGVIVLPAVTRPHHFVRVAKNTGSVVFRRLSALLWIQTLDQQQMSGYQDGNPQYQGEVLAFTDSASFNAFWGQHASIWYPPPPTPSVNFATEMVIAAFQGYRNQGGYEVTVTDVQSDPPFNALVVFVYEDEITDYTDVITNPCHIVKAPKASFGTMVVRRSDEVPFQTVDQGAFSGYQYGNPNFQGQNLVIRDNPTWLNTWSQHVSNQSPPPPAPFVDFSQDMAIGAWMGIKPSSGYAIDILKVVHDWCGEAEVTLQHAFPSGVTLPVITNPYHIVTTQTFAGTVKFKVQ